ncbi:MAG TPA: enoyl-CoA hydratase/isomerase family protein [Candidatus Nitrosotenuis sp.]|nr:enoyl-CoA hydratase/isomerase family protein [Candidatus Nitrosotenuis sp.]
MNSSLRIEPRENILLLHLESPDDFPRLTRAVLAQLLQAVENAQPDASVSAAVISGTEKCFAAGADLEEVSALAPLEARRFAELGQSLMRRIETSRKPVVAAIRGHCLGGGFDLALACHLRVAAGDARLGHPGGSLGIFTGWGGTQRLPRLIGRSHAEELLFTGRLISAREAQAWKLVNRVVPPEETLAVALHLAQQAASTGAAANVD